MIEKGGGGGGGGLSVQKTVSHLRAFRGDRGGNSQRQKGVGEGLTGLFTVTETGRDG
jgi:hypothetical protein